MDFGTYFYENWLDKVVTAVGVIVGVVSAVGILISKISECVKTFKANTDIVVKKSEELGETNRLQRELTEAFRALKESLEEVSERNTNISEQSEKTKRQLMDEIDILRKAMYIAFVNNSELVKKGSAEKISALIGDKDEFEG